ncbi:MAG: outer membrane beta-barrel protein [Acidobacteriia bacterium]|nr:outer membrane beta-barrel protein [Terriglobia bacterium]
MTRGVVLRLALVLAGMSFFSATAAAEGFRLSAVGSGSFLFGEKLFTRVNEPWRSDFADGGRVAIAGEYTANKVIGFEAGYAYGRNNLRLSNVTENIATGYGVQLQRVNGNLMIHSPVKLIGLQPYATIGADYNRFGPTSGAKTLAATEGFAGAPAQLEASNKFGFNACGGVEWYIVRAFAVRLDVRNHLTGTPRFGLNQAQFPVTGTTNNVEISAGFTIHFGD